MSVAVVTDSTAYLPIELSGKYDLTVVPLTVVVNGVEGLEGEEIAPAEVARALGARRAEVRTSRPAPEQFVLTYQRLLDAGADGIVSVRLGERLRDCYITEIGAVVAAHAGPGVVGVVVHRRRP